MDHRATYKPFNRMNKSVLFLGLTWEDMIPGLLIFVISQILTKDLFISSFFSILFILISAVYRKKHRSRILKDVLINLLTKDVVNVARVRCIKPNKKY